ncbi:hypothetical protein AJ78_05237 [Emergomyces pasteurianus Ep9510]|uniref:Uncharacterized protein n=1 Tax=Emergomyces pasteurianus Ep9510 TaxID=1447872 RepID=A0A1J9QEP6_9EURO|nr:hypothetical protein AJ78_05237 [Emergomyces pasteurianus Ep9510]
MNCPSRTDQCPDHPDWNQNPPSLTSDLTTCEDLNGLVNSRAHRNQTSPSSGSPGCCDGPQNQESLEKPASHYHPPHAPSADAGCQLWNKEDTCSATRRGPPVISHTMSWPVGIYQRFCQRPIWIWRSTLLLLLVLLSFYFGPTLFAYASSLKSDIVHKLPSRRLQRRGTCSNDPGDAASHYNTPLHVAALIIILCISSSACAFPLVAIKVPFLRIPGWFLFVARHFGTGVLIATAFVHLLPTAFGSLNDPCLSSFWTQEYQPMPGAIALAAVFFVTVVEMVFSPGRHCCSDKGTANIYTRDAEKGHSACSSGSGTTDASLRRDRPLGGNSNSLGRELAHMNADLVETERAQSLDRATVTEVPKAFDDEQREASADDASSIKLTPEQQHKKAVMQCMLLEMGILFHSVFIGMALSVSTGSAFVVLLIAISFHQTFEGLALGSRIAAIKWEGKTIQPWLMALTYGCTTPIGQAIGLGTHTLYDPNSEFGLILVGTMNAISSGLLIYSSLVELLAEDFLSDESWRCLRGKKRIIACLLVFFGAFSMSLVGAWA